MRRACVPRPGIPNSIRVSGLESSTDGETVREALEGVPDVGDAQVDWRSGRADADGDPEYDDVVDAVESVGYRVRD